MSISTERKYDARITAVFKSGESVTGAQSGKQGLFLYSATAVNTPDKLTLTMVAPFRRWIFGSGDSEPDIVAAQVGDDCEIAMCQGQARLVDVPEQYMAGGCDDPNPS